MGMWALWASTEVEPHSIQILNHRVSYPPADRDPAVAPRRRSMRCGRRFACSTASWPRPGFLVGGRFTVADVNVAEVVRYALAAPELFEATPALRRWLEACHARPGFKRMMADRELEPE